MFAVVVLVLDNPELLPDVLRCWDEAGVQGATVLASTGMRRVAKMMGRDDMPLMPTLRDLTQSEELAQQTIFTVVQQTAVDDIIEATERVVGKLDQPDTGVLFVLPATRVVGGRIGSQ